MGSMFATCADHLIRSQMAHLVDHEGRISLSANDVAIAVLNLVAAFSGIMAMIAAWRGVEAFEVFDRARWCPRRIHAD